MTKKEQKQIQKEVAEQTLGIYAGILFNNQTFTRHFFWNFDIHH